MSQTFLDWDSTAGNNTTVGTGAIDIDEGCAPGNVNNALREIMAAAVRSAGLAGLQGSGSRPSGTQSSQFWTDIADAANPVIYWYDGTDDIEFATISNSGNTITLSSSVSATLDIVNDTTPQLGGNLDVNGNTITSASNGDVTVDPNGTGTIILGAATVTIEDDLTHAGDTDNKITFGTDTQTFTTGASSRMDISDGGVRLGAANARVTTVLDEDTMSSDSATALATQQSIKAYVDSKGIDKWVNFDGNPVAINASSGVSSVTDLGVGDYRVNFSASFSDANYAALTTAQEASNPDCNAIVVTTTTGTCTVNAYDDGLNALTDPDQMHCIFAR